MPNVLPTAQIFSNVFLLLLKNQLIHGKLVDGQFKDEVSDTNGLVVNIKRPPRFISKNDGTAALSVQDIVSGSANVAVNQYEKVHMSVGDIEYVTSYNDLLKNAAMKSAASAMAHKIDMFIASKLALFPSWVAGGQAGGNGVQPAP